MSRTLAILAAIFFFLWGLIHIGAAIGTYRSGLGLDPGIIQGRVFQTAFFLLAAAVAAIVLAWWNAKNRKWAFGANAAVTTAADIPFILFLVVPGHVGFPANTVGPTIWIIALVLGALALIAERRQAVVNDV